MLYFNEIPSLHRFQSLDPTTALDFIGGLLYHMDTVTSVIDAHQVSETRFSTPPTYHTFTESQINTLADLVLAEMVQTSRADEPNSMPAEVHRHIRLLFACASQSDTLLKSLVKHFARTPSSQSPATVRANHKIYLMLMVYNYPHATAMVDHYVG